MLFQYKRSIPTENSTMTHSMPTIRTTCEYNTIHVEQTTVTCYVASHHSTQYGNSIDLSLDSHA